MGRKNILYSFTAINEADMSQASIVGQATNVAGFDTVTYLATWSGGQATNGDIGMETSLDEGKTWHDLDFGAIIDTDGAQDYARIIINEIGFGLIRPKYTRTNAGATGLLTMKIFGTNKGA